MSLELQQATFLWLSIWKITKSSRAQRDVAGSAGGILSSWLRTFRGCVKFAFVVGSKKATRYLTSCHVMRIFRLLPGQRALFTLLNKLDLCAPYTLSLCGLLPVSVCFRAYVRLCVLFQCDMLSQCTVYLPRLLNLKSSASRFRHQPTSLGHTLRFCASNLSCIFTLF